MHAGDTLCAVTVARFHNKEELLDVHTHRTQASHTTLTKMAGKLHEPAKHCQLFCWRKETAGKGPHKESARQLCRQSLLCKP